MTEVLLTTIWGIRLAVYLARRNGIRDEDFRYVAMRGRRSNFAPLEPLGRVPATGTAAWSLIGPALISFMLLRVSGVTMQERGLKKRRPGYEDYVRRTSAFFPRPPRAGERP